MKNSKALAIWTNAKVLGSIENFDVAKAIIRNLHTIDQDLLEVIRKLPKKAGKEDKVIDEIMAKDCDLKFYMIKESDLPKNLTVEQMDLLWDWIEWDK